MGFRDWLTGCTVTLLLGAPPAFAESPRSLFEALPAPDAVPLATSLEPLGPLRPTVPPPTPPVRPAILGKAPTDPAADEMATSTRPVAETGSDVQPLAGAAASRTAVLALPPVKPAFLRLRLASAEIVPDVAAAPAVAPAPFSLFAPAPLPVAEAAPAEPAKPLTAAERRRAERLARQEAAARAAAPDPVAPAATPTFAANPFTSLFGPALVQRDEGSGPADRGRIDAWVSHHARLNHVPEALVHRIIVRESKYNARAVGRGGAMGLMQIKTATARGVGYTGGPAGLLDAETNLTYGIKYLAGAWRVAGGSHDRAVSHYARGYYYEAKRRGLGGRQGETETAVLPAQGTPSFLSLFSRQASAQ